MTDITAPEQNIPTDLSSVDIGKVLPDLQEYNSQFSIGTYMFDFLEDRVRDQTIPQEKTPHITIEDIYKRHPVEFENTGLSLEPVKGAAIMVGPDGKKETSEMRLNLSDGGKFQIYINALKPDSISASQAEGLKTVAELLTSQLAYQYRLNDPSDERMMELFSHISGIVRRYQELDPDSTKGIAGSVERLNNYWEIAKKKYLREYLAVENTGLLNGGEHFGPAAWHTDMSIGNYINRWRDAIEIARMIGQNPNAAGLYRETVDSLVKSLTEAREDILKRVAQEGKYGEKDYANEYGKEDSERLVVVEENLKTLEEMKAQLSPKEK